MTLETFEQVLSHATASGSLNPAFVKFLKTTFCVPISLTGADSTVQLALHEHEAAAAGRQALLISEDAARLGIGHGSGQVRISGADIVTRLQSEADIVIALSNGLYHIAWDRVEWLKKNVAAAYARAAAEKAAAAKPAPAAPAPAPAAAAVPPPALQPLTLAPEPAVARPRPLDVAALRPNLVSHPDLGVQLFVPGAWVETRNTRSVFYVDPAGSTKVELTAPARAFMPLQEWQSQRLSQVQLDMPFLQQEGGTVNLSGMDWGDKVKATATEYVGVFPGDSEPTRMLVACFWAGGLVASVAIRARAADFEAQRPVYRWLLERVEALPASAAVQDGLPGGDYMDAGLGETADPPLFSLSTSGRIGRIRALAYATCITLPCGIAMSLGGVLAPSSPVAGMTLILFGGLLATAFSARLLALRMHDMNWSAKPLLALYAGIFIAGGMRNTVMMSVLSVIFWLMAVALFYVLPGNEDDNDYGPPTSEETTAMKILAGLFVIINLFVIYAQFTAIRSAPKAGASGPPMSQMEKDIRRMEGLDGPETPIKPLEGMRAFLPGDRSFSVSLPGEAVELPSRWNNYMAYGQGKARVYELAAGGHTYTIHALKYDEEPSDPFKIMNKLEEQLVGGDVALSAEPFGVDGRTGREVRIRQHDGKIKAVRFIVFGQRVAMVAVTVPAAEAANPKVNEVLYSLALLK